MLLLPLIPVAILIVLANMGQVDARFRWLTLVILLAMSVVVAAAGVVLMLVPPAILAAMLKPGLALGEGASGGWLVASGGLTAVIVLAAMVAWTRAYGPGPRGQRWFRPVQLTAAVLAFLFIGLNLAFASLIRDPRALAGNLQVGVVEVFLQNLAFVAFSLLGVGLWLRRGWSEAWQRLGVTSLTPAHVTVAFTWAWGLVGLSLLAGGVLSVLFPQASANAEVLNQVVVGAFATPGGAILLGLLTGIGEEVLYRGALQPVFGIWLTSFIFAAHHLQYLSPAIVLVFGLGFALGWVRQRWNTTTAALVHAIYNTTLVLLALAASQALGT